MQSLHDETRVAFDKWHNLGNKRGYPSPELKKMALNLLNHYSHSQVSAAAGICPRTLKKWEKSYLQDKTSVQDANFIPIVLPQDTKQSTEVNVSPPLTLNLPNNLQLIICEQSSKRAIQFIYALVKEFE